jgi:hypothetical protein
VGGQGKKNPPTSRRDSLVVLVGGQGRKHPPTSRRDSLVVLVGGRGKRHPPTCHRDTLVVLVGGGDVEGWVGGQRKGRQRVGCDSLVAGGGGRAVGGG